MTQSSQPPASAGSRYTIAAGELTRDKSKTLTVWREGGFVEHAAGDSARFDWFYQDNPAGQGQLSLLYCDSESPVGVLGVCPRQFVVDARSVLAGVLVDFVVHPAHRTALPALQLQRAARARAAESMAILYGLPDTKAIPIFKRLGHAVHFELPSYARVLHTKPYLARLMPAFVASPIGFVLDRIDAVVLRARISTQRLVNAACRDMQGTWVDKIGEEFDRLWMQLAKERLCMGVRDADFLRWRFGRRPGFSYRTFAIRSKSTQRLCAYFVCDIGANGIAIKDCLILGGQVEWTYALNLLCREARRMRAQAVYLHFAGPEYAVNALRSAGFRKRSARPFFAAVDVTELGAAAWYVTQADEDV